MANNVVCTGKGRLLLDYGVSGALCYQARTSFCKNQKPLNILSGKEHNKKHSGRQELFSINTALSHKYNPICNLKFSSSHSLKSKKKQMEFILIIFFLLNPALSRMLSFPICNQYNNFYTDALFYILGFLYEVFEIQCVFDTYRTSLFGLVTVSVLSRHNVAHGYQIGWGRCRGWQRGVFYPQSLIPQFSKDSLSLPLKQRVL